MSVLGAVPLVVFTAELQQHSNDIVTHAKQVSTHPISRSTPDTILEFVCRRNDDDYQLRVLADAWLLQAAWPPNFGDRTSSLNWTTLEKWTIVMGGPRRRCSHFPAFCRFLVVFFDDCRVCGATKPQLRVVQSRLDVRYNISGSNAYQRDALSGTGLGNAAQAWCAYAIVNMAMTPAAEACRRCRGLCVHWRWGSAVICGP